VSSEPVTKNEPQDEEKLTVSRRWLLLKLGIAFNGAVAWRWLLR